MMGLLSIGSVIRLKEGERKLMITSRTPLANEGGVLGYFDYGGCLYPDGQIDQKTFFFNEEDIEEICFEGYCDSMEEEYRKKYEQAIKNIKYPKLKVQRND